MTKYKKNQKVKEAKSTANNQWGKKTLIKGKSQKLGRKYAVDSGVRARTSSQVRESKRFCPPPPILGGER